MADIAGKLYRELQTDQVRTNRAQRRANRHKKYTGLGAAVQERTAELKWYLDGASAEDGTPIHAGEHPGTAALSVAGATLAQFDMPSGYDIQYRGMSRKSGRGQHAMDEGTITVGVVAPARSGIKAYFDIPFIVKNSRIIDPSVLMHQGLPRILAQSTFDDIFGQKEFHAPPADRSTMFSPPPSKEEAQEIRERPWTTVRRRTVFDVMPKRSNIQAAIRGYTTEEDVRHAPYAKKAADGYGDYLQDAERDQLLVPKMMVKLTEDVEAKERGGEYYILPKGDCMTLLRSLDGTDRGRFEVEDDNGDRWIVPGKSLTKKGSYQKAGGEEKVIEYWGNAPDIIDPAKKLGWEFAEDDYVDASGVIDWDKALAAATEFLQNHGYRVDYN